MYKSIFAFTSSCSALLFDEFEDQRSWERLDLVGSGKGGDVVHTKEEWTCRIVVPSWILVGGWVVNQRWAQKHWHAVAEHVWGLVISLFLRMKGNIVPSICTELAPCLYFHVTFAANCCVFPSRNAHVLWRPKTWVSVNGDFWRAVVSLLVSLPQQDGSLLPLQWSSNIWWQLSEKQPDW